MIVGQIPGDPGKGYHREDPACHDEHGSDLKHPPKGLLAVRHSGVRLRHHPPQLVQLDLTLLQTQNFYTILKHKSVQLSANIQQ